MITTNYATVGILEKVHHKIGSASVHAHIIYLIWLPVSINNKIRKENFGENALLTVI